jgi:hypothetical protein
MFMAEFASQSPVSYCVTNSDLQIVKAKVENQPTKFC